MTSPPAVVMSASAIPPETSLGSMMDWLPPSSSNDWMMPDTVPRMPSIGLAVTMVESTLEKRSVCMRISSICSMAVASSGPSSSMRRASWS